MGNGAGGVGAGALAGAELGVVLGVLCGSDEVVCPRDGKAAKVAINRATVNTTRMRNVDLLFESLSISRFIGTSTHLREPGI